MEIPRHLHCEDCGEAFAESCIFNEYGRRLCRTCAEARDIEKMPVERLREYVKAIRSREETEITEDE